MPNQPHHEVLVFKKTVWLSVLFDMEQDTQHWRVYKRRMCHRKGTGAGEWWVGLVRTVSVLDLKNRDLPKPILKAYAFTEWTLWDTPKRPNGTDLWVEYDSPNQFQIWYSQLNWREVLDTRKDDWEYMGLGFWESE